MFGASLGPCTEDRALRDPPYRPRRVYARAPGTGKRMKNNARVQQEGVVQRIAHCAILRTEPAKFPLFPSGFLYKNL